MSEFPPLHQSASTPHCSSLSPPSMAATAAASDASLDIDANPLLHDFDFPLFDAVEAKHVRPGIRALLKSLESDLEEPERTVEPSWPKLVEPWEKIIDRLSVVWGIVNHLKSVKDSDELRSAIEDVQPEKVKFQLRLGQSKPIYNAFKAIQESPDWPKLSEAQKRGVEYKSLYDTHRLKSALSRITQDCDQWIKPQSSSFGSSLPTHADLISTNPLSANFGHPPGTGLRLKERCTAAESLSLIARILHRSRNHLQSMLLQCPRGGICARSCRTHT